MNDACDDDPVNSAEMVTFQLYGDYLCVEHPGGPRYIYRRVAADASPHPLTSRTVFAGTVYSLVTIEDDKE